MITSQTGLIGLLGWPVAHSHSAAMQNAAIEALGLDLRYLAFSVAPEHLQSAIVGARALGIRGLSRSGQPLTLASRVVEGKAWIDPVLAEVLQEADLVVDATSRGLDDRAPSINLAPLHPEAIVLDLAVRRETALVRAARERGL